MDQNKQVKLRVIGYKVNESCGLCQHATFPNDDWGTCGVHTYEHLKHAPTEDGRQLSINRFGSCPQFRRNEMAIVKLHAYEEFLTPYVRAQDVSNAVYAAASAECEDIEHRVGLRSPFNGHHAAQRIVEGFENESAKRELFGRPKDGSSA